MSIGVNKKESVVCFKNEVTPGVPVNPSGTGDYMAVKGDFTSTYEREVLNSELISAQIGMRKGQVGMITTGADLANEFKHSGTEGVEPEYNDLLESLMGGPKNIETTELDLVAGSTTSVVNVDSGEGASLAVGQALLFKENLGSQGYQIRPIKSIATDAITVEPVLPAAPVATTNLGKCVTYNVGSAHKHGTLNLYWGNTLKEQIAGCLVESMSLEVATGQIISASYTLAGLNRSFVDGTAPHTPVYDASTGLVGLDVECYLGADLLCAPTVTLNVNNELADLTCVKEETGKVSSRVKSRELEITVNPYTDDTTTTFQTLFDAQTDFSFVLIAGKKDSSGWLPGTCFCLYAPRCYIQNAPLADEDDIITNELTIKPHIGTGLPEFFVNFL